MEATTGHQASERQEKRRSVEKEGRGGVERQMGSNATY